MKTMSPCPVVLYESPSVHGALIVQFDDGVEDHYHVAEACNIAAVINSVRRILSLPRSEIACEEMSEVLILRLDVLREYIRATVETSHKGSYSESEADKMIRRWAGFLNTLPTTFSRTGAFRLTALPMSHQRSKSIAHF